MRFVAVDVETANADMASICAVGAAVFEHGRLSSEWYSLVDPDDYFDPVNVSIHGIDENAVLGAPAYKDVSDTIEPLLFGATVVTHTHFDRVAMRQAAHRWAIEAPRCAWLDSARIARRTWSECARSGYGLADVCKRIGYEFRHHNALCEHHHLSKQRPIGIAGTLDCAAGA
jgi:DNA polymerase-3 subunit epsilon